jgi:Ca2+-binding RTX toxin-like protein
LTKGEKLDIKLTGFTDKEELSYKIVKKDLVISYVGDDKNTYTLTLKNFGTKDVTNNATKKTENDSYVKLYLDDNLVYDLREGNYLPMYSDFTTKKYKYTGNWHSETITAVALNETFPSKDRGASINGGAGNDIIVGCKYNDTIKGGDGNDTIVSGLGNDKVDGGNGNDGYLLFYVEKELGKYENVTITDTGKNKADIDLVELYTTSDDVSIWFNMDKTGKATYKFNVEQLSTANSAIISGVERIVADGADKDASNDLIYDYSSDALKESIISFFESSAGLAYKDVNDVMKNGRQEEIQLLMGYFNGAWTTV